MNIHSYTSKDIGILGEKIVAEYLRRYGFTIEARNYAKETGEIDLIAKKGRVLHFVEVKSVLCDQFPDSQSGDVSSAQCSTSGGTEVYDPSVNLHQYKIQKVARTSEWYMAEKHWEGECQIDGALVWIRKSDGIGKVRYLPQIL